MKINNQVSRQRKLAPLPTPDPLYSELLLAKVHFAMN